MACAVKRSSGWTTLPSWGIKMVWDRSSQPRSELQWRDYGKGTTERPKDLKEQTPSEEVRQEEWHAKRLGTRTIYLERLTGKPMLLYLANWLCYTLFELVGWYLVSTFLVSIPPVNIWPVTQTHFSSCFNHELHNRSTLWHTGGASRSPWGARPICK